MTFPARLTVQLAVFNGTGEDGLGNDAETWGRPENVQVIQCVPSSTESTNGHSSRVVSDVDLFVPPGFSVSMRDRFTIPGFIGPLEVVAVEDHNHGFHGWTPGSVVKLKQVTG